ncbi:hypothetical protein GH733_002804 [Mirounga leonina]|nr:hypothetical protein GH733_002804 [Mirounga leonina]
MMTQQVENLKSAHAKKPAELEEPKQKYWSGGWDDHAVGIFWGHSKVNTIPHYMDLRVSIPRQMLKKKNVN